MEARANWPFYLLPGTSQSSTQRIRDRENREHIGCIDAMKSSERGNFLRPWKLRTDFSIGKEAPI